MKKEDIGIIAGLAVAGLASYVFASGGMPWETPLQTVSNSISGVGGASACSIGLAWTGVNWARGTEHGRESFIGMATGTGLCLGAPRAVGLFGGGAGGAEFDIAPLLPMTTFISDLIGELLGHGVYAAWLYAGLLFPLVWRKQA